MSSSGKKTGTKRKTNSDDRVHTQLMQVVDESNTLTWWDTLRWLEVSALAQRRDPQLNAVLQQSAQAMDLALYPESDFQRRFFAALETLNTERQQAVILVVVTHIQYHLNHKRKYQNVSTSLLLPGLKDSVRDEFVMIAALGSCCTGSFSLASPPLPCLREFRTCGFSTVSDWCAEDNDGDLGNRVFRDYNVIDLPDELRALQLQCTLRMSGKHEFKCLASAVLDRWCLAPVNPQAQRFFLPNRSQEKACAIYDSAKEMVHASGSERLTVYGVHLTHGMWIRANGSFVDLNVNHSSLTLVYGASSSKTPHSAVGLLVTSEEKLSFQLNIFDEWERLVALASTYRACLRLTALKHSIVVLMLSFLHPVDDSLASEQCAWAPRSLP